MKEAMAPGKQAKQAESLASGQGGAVDDEGYSIVARNGKAAKPSKPGGKGPQQVRGRASVTADTIVEDRTAGAKRPGEEADDAERLARDQKGSEDVEAKGASKGSK